jgi:small GTP-binding protein
MANKVVFVGDSGVGKTAIIQAGLHNDFGGTSPTIAAGEFRLDVKLSGSVVKLLVWDTAGQDTYAALIPHYVRQARGCILTFSLVDELSLESIPQWARLVSEYESIPHLFVVGNKLDLADRRQVSEDRGQEIANSISADYFETSAKTGSGIESLFTEVAKAFNTPEQKPEVTSVKLTQTLPNKKRKKRCCT